MRKGREHDEQSEILISAGLLLLRLSGGGGLALILILNQPEGHNLFLTFSWRIWLLLCVSVCAFFVVCGILARLAAAISTAIWAFAALSELLAGNPWFVLPVRDCEFVFLFATLALAGPGEFSFEPWLKSVATRGRPW